MKDIYRPVTDVMKGIYRPVTVVTKDISCGQSQKPELPEACVGLLLLSRVFLQTRLRFSKTAPTKQACVTVRHTPCIFSLEDKEPGTINQTMACQ